MFDAHCRSRLLLLFLWQSIGPMMWNASIKTRDIAGQVFLTVTTDPGELVVAALTAGEPDFAIQCFLRDYFRSNGSAYGNPLFGSLPTIAENHAPDVVSPHLLGQCYADVMRWIEARFDPYAWAALEESLVAENAAPDRMTEVLDFLERHLEKGYAEALETHKAERSAEIDARARAYLLARSLEMSYTEI